MKTKIITLLTVLTLVFGPGTLSAQNIGINATGATPNASAALDIDVNQKGLLIPRMSTADRNLINSPATGLLIWNTDCENINAYTSSGWQMITIAGNAPGTSSSITGIGTVCQSQSGMAFSVGAIIGATGYVWTYSGAGFTIATGGNSNSITADFSSTATSGKLTVYATNACGNGTVSPAHDVIVNIITTAVIATSTPNPICEASTLTLIGSATGATNWSWTGPNGFISSLQSPAIASVSTAGAGVYTLTASNNSCGSAAPVNTTSVTVNTIPTGVTASASPNPAPSGCPLTLTGSATGATNWSWTGPNGFTSSLQSPTIASVTTAGAGVYTLTASNFCGSATPVNTASVTVTLASGGTITYSGGYTIHTFTTSGNFVRGGCGSTVEVFLVGGGGSGGCYNNAGGMYPGGGGGGYTQTYINVPVTGTIPIIVGDGGTGVPEQNAGNAGGYSRFGSTSTYQANGGAGGGAINNGGSGGSGGGGAHSVGGSDGSNGGGSGGVGQGTTTREFGIGTGTLYSGGGGGGTWTGAATGGAGGGGAGSGTNWNSGCASTCNGTPNTGGGGGGRATYLIGGSSGTGGSGIVIIRYIP